MRRPHCCASAAPLRAQINVELDLSSKVSTPFSLRAFGRDKNGAERWIYLTSMGRRTINTVFLVKPLLARHRCAAGGCVAPAN